MLVTSIQLKDIEWLEEKFSKLTADGWKIPNWLIYLKGEVIKRDQNNSRRWSQSTL